MKARIASTLVIWFSTVAILYFGKAWGGLALLVLLGGAAQWEFYTLLEKLGAKPRKIYGIVIGSLLPVFVFLKGAGLIGNDAVRVVDQTKGRGAVESFFHRLVDTDVTSTHTVGEFRADMTAFAIIGVAIAAVFFVQLARHASGLIDIIRRTPTLFGVIGFPFMMALYAWPAGVRWAYNGDPTGVYWVVWCVAVTKFTDVGALLAGKAFGKNKLWPAVSPGKTWEGCLGGVITSCAVGAGLALLFAKLDWSLSLSPGKAALVALPLAILSVPSDLVESVFKRLTGVKDSGRTIPGIGGAYDLVDSLLLTAPVSLLLYLAVTA